MLALALRRTGSHRRPLPPPARAGRRSATVGALLLLVRPTAAGGQTSPSGAAWVPLLAGHRRAGRSPLGLLTLGAGCGRRGAGRPPAAGAAAPRRRRDARRCPGAALLGDDAGAAGRRLRLRRPRAAGGGDPGRCCWCLAALAAGALVVRERRDGRPLLDPREFAAPAAWGSLLVSLLLGVALMAVLVDVPVFARATRFPDDQTGAALVLLRFLVAVPVGAWRAAALLDRLGAAAAARRRVRRWPRLGLVAMTPGTPTALDGRRRWPRRSLLVTAASGWGWRSAR